jgi:hypothetical protein
LHHIIVFSIESQKCSDSYSDNNYAEAKCKKLSFFQQKAILQTLLLAMALKQPGTLRHGAVADQ